MASSDSIPAEVLSDGAAEVNLEHTCDSVGLYYPAFLTLYSDLWSVLLLRYMCFNL